jgi:membrane protein
MRFHPKTIGRLIKTAVTGWSDDDVPAMAAALSYTAILSLAPLLILLVGVFSMLFGADTIEGEIVTQVNDAFGERAAQAIRSIIRAAEMGTRGTIAIGGSTLILLIIFASGVFQRLILSLNSIWGIPPEKRRGIKHGILRLIRRRTLAFVMVLIIGLWFYASLAMSAVRAVPESFILENLPGAEKFLVHMPLLVSPIMFTVIFALLFKLLPDKNVEWRYVWCGALITGMLFVISNKLIAYYLQRTIVASFYGAASSLIVVLLWVYWLAMIFLFGAEITKACATIYGAVEKQDVQ